jgi:uncharacterized membrane protein YccC
VASWGRVVAGVVIGVAGTLYATNEDVRKNLPKAARDLPDNVRRRYRSAVAAAREASARRREEILHDLEEHGGGNHAARGVKPDPDAGVARMNAMDEDTSTDKPEQRQGRD